MGGPEADRREEVLEPPAKKPRLEGGKPASRGFAIGRCLAGMGRQEHGGPPSPFQFVQMADTQFGMEDSFKGRVGSGWGNEVKLFRQAIDVVNRMKPAFAIVCGDLIDEWPPEEYGREGAVIEKREQQERDFKAAIQHVDADIPLLCVCGNHDIGDRPNSATIRRFQQNFGDDYFSFWCHGAKCLVVNSSLWKDDRDAQPQRAEMDAWLDRELAEVRPSGDEPPRPVLVFSHIAPFIYDAHEKDEYFNLDSSLRLPLMEKLRAHGAVGWFCGHYHRNAGGIFRNSDGQELEVVVTGAVGVQITDKEGGEVLGKSGIGGSSIGDEVSGLRLVRVGADGRLSHRWQTFAELKREAAAASSSSSGLGR